MVVTALLKKESLFFFALSHRYALTEVIFLTLLKHLVFFLHLCKHCALSVDTHIGITL